MTKINSTQQNEIAELVRLYKRGSLSREQLDRLKVLTDSMDEQELADAFDSIAGNNEFPALTDSRVDSIVADVMDQIQSQPSFWMRMIKPFAAAAAIIIPILLIGGIILYNKVSQFDTYKSIIAQETVISTGVDERVSVNLPDGSSVTLNSETNLSYSITDFNDKERRVDMDGYASFKVASKEKCPFIINCKELNVKVLGTIFDLMARSAASQAMLYLKEGSVEMVSESTGEKVKVTPSQLVILDYSTGHFTMRTMKNNNDAMAALRGDLIYSGAPFDEMILSVEKHYGIKIEYDSKRFINKKFTGYLPADNLNESLRILEKAYGLRSYATDKENTYELR